VRRRFNGRRADIAGERSHSHISTQRQQRHAVQRENDAKLGGDGKRGSFEPAKNSGESRRAKESHAAKLGSADEWVRDGGGRDPVGNVCREASSIKTRKRVMGSPVEMSREFSASTQFHNRVDDDPPSLGDRKGYSIGLSSHKRVPWRYR